MSGKAPQASTTLCTRAGPIAQRLEQRTHNPLVEGSNPSGPTNQIRHLAGLPGISSQRRKIFRKICDATACLHGFAAC